MTAYIELTPAELAYRLVSRHWQRCARCYAAGGEWALPANLCGLGRALEENWRMAEERERQQAVAEDIRTGAATWLDETSDNDMPNDAPNGTEVES